MWLLDHLVSWQRHFDVRRSCYIRVECAVNAQTQQYYRETVDSRPDGQLYSLTGERVLCVTDDEWSDIPAVKFYLDRTTLSPSYPGYLEATLFWHTSFAYQEAEAAAYVFRIRFV